MIIRFINKFDDDASLVCHTDTSFQAFVDYAHHYPLPVMVIEIILTLRQNLFQGIRRKSCFSRCLRAVGDAVTNGNMPAGKNTATDTAAPVGASALRRPAGCFPSPHKVGFHHHFEPDIANGENAALMLR